MMSVTRELPRDDYTAAIPAFLTMIVMLFVIYFAMHQFAGCSALDG